MATNPNPARITAASWWFMEQLLVLEPGTVNGGIFANKSGYHNTRLNNQKSWPGNYSITDSEDRGGPSDKAAAYDWTFRDAQAERYGTIIKYTKRLLASAKDTDDPRLNGWREFYGQADQDRQVEGWDTRYLRAASSDPSHLWHLHFSEDRNQVDSFDNKKAMLSVLRGETVAEWRGQDDMELTDKVKLGSWIPENWPGLDDEISVNTALGSAYGHARSAKDGVYNQVLPALVDMKAQIAALTAAVGKLAEAGGADPEAIREAAESGARAALADLQITWSTDGE
jgi:hypothetical protein